MGKSQTGRILILCKTYPSPSAKYAETSCVAGMSEAGRLIRLYPVPFRLVADEHQFKKWQWITARIQRSSDDRRVESHRLFVDTIQLGEIVPLQNGAHLRGSATNVDRRMPAKLRGSAIETAQ